MSFVMVTESVASDTQSAFDWSPTSTYLEQSRLLQLCSKQGLTGYHDLLNWASADIGRYWGAVVEDLGLTFLPGFDQVLDLSRGRMWPEWFPGGGFNYVESALDRWIANGLGDKTAVIWEGDGREIREWSYHELHRETHLLATVYRRLGIRKGDRVGIYLPMIPETVAAVLAAGAVGAIFIPLFSGYGAEAVASRLRDCEAKLLVTADGFFRRGKHIPMKRVADAAVRAAPTVNQVLVVRRSGEPIEWQAGRDVWIHDATADGTIGAETEPTAANDPYMVIYTSGTTGKPKGAVHVHAGFPIKSAHDLAYCFDLHAEDSVFWLTDLGWMMGPWLISGGLMLGSTIVLFEGTPDYPKPDRLWRIAERHCVSVLGVAPTGIRALMPLGNEWVESVDLSSLRVLGSTGETWNEEPWRWYFEKVGEGRCPIINYSGGTETGGGIVGCVTSEPIKSCGFRGPVPGMDADVFDESAEPVRGAVGELVARQPWVGMTRGFWNDSDRYESTYWSRFDDTWVHGDWAEIDEDGYWYIRGRSDDTLNIAGKRIGPAEIESAAVAHNAVREAAAIGIPDSIKGEVVCLFVVLNQTHQHSDEMSTAICATVVDHLGPALRPSQVEYVDDLPKTRNAKVMRRLIRSSYLGEDHGDTTALENPDSIAQIALCGQQAVGVRKGAPG